MSNSLLTALAMNQTEVAAFQGAYQNASSVINPTPALIPQASFMHNVTEIAKSVKSQATKALAVNQTSYALPIDSGQAQQGDGGDGSSSTSLLTKQTTAITNAALGYVMTGNIANGTAGNSSFAQYAVNSIMYAISSYANVSGDSIDNRDYVGPIATAYASLCELFTPAQTTAITSKLLAIDAAETASYNASLAIGSETTVNNHESWRLQEKLKIGMATNNTQLIRDAASGFKTQIGLLSQCDGFGPDFGERDALHYVCLNMEALMSMAKDFSRILQIPNAAASYGIDFTDPYNLSVNGGSINNTMNKLMPFLTGQLVRTNEFANSTNPNDAGRIASGSLHTTFNPIDGLNLLASALYLTPTINGTGVAPTMAAIAANNSETVVASLFPTIPAYISLIQNDYISVPQLSISSSSTGSPNPSTGSSTAVASSVPSGHSSSLSSSPASSSISSSQSSSLIISQSSSEPYATSSGNHLPGTNKSHVDNDLIYAGAAIGGMIVALVTLDFGANRGRVTRFLAGSLARMVMRPVQLVKNCYNYFRPPAALPPQPVQQDHHQAPVDIEMQRSTSVSQTQPNAPLYTTKVKKSMQAQPAHDIPPR